MVRSKEAPKKKPKDPLLTPPSSKPRGGFLEEGRPWNRGGAAMSPAPASVPSYMRGTSSSDAKAGRRGRPAASVSASASPARRMTAASVPASPARRIMMAASVSASASPARRRPLVRVLTRGKVLFPEEAPGSGSGLGRATCSSTMKESKFPDALDLAPGATDAEGPAALRVCPYTYCSLNGHVHAPAVPLRSFLASRRRLIKTQQSMKLKGVSAFRKKSSGDKTSGGSGVGGAKMAPLIDEEEVGDFFVEVYAGPRVSSDMSCSDMSLDEVDATVRKMEFVVFDRCGADENSEKGNDLAVCDGGEPEPHLRLQGKHGACRDSLSECSCADTSGDFIEELPWMRYHGYEYDSLDDEISEEQRLREEAAGGAEICKEQEENQEDEQGTSGRSAGDCEVHAAEEQKTIDDTSVMFRETEFIPDQGVACREACEDPDGRDEDSILDTVCCGDASAGQETSEEKLSDDFCKSEIPDQEVTGWVDTILEESCKEETTTDPEANDDECSVESDGDSEVTEEKDVEGEESTPDDGSEMEISEDTIPGDGSRDDLSEEVTSRSIPEDDRTEDYAAEQYTGTVDDVIEQDGSIPELASEETATVQQTDQDGSMDDTGDSLKELEITTCILEEVVEGSGLARESSLSSVPTCVDDGPQVEPNITTCKSNGSSEESIATEESCEDNNAEKFTDGAERGPEITRCKLEAGSEESGIDLDTVEDNNSACMSDSAQNDLHVTNCKLEDTSRESVTTQETDECDSCANVSSDTQATVEYDDSANVIEESCLDNNAEEITRCKLESTSEESGIDLDTVEDNNSACISDSAQNDLHVTNCKLEDISRESVTTQETDECDRSANVSSDAQSTVEYDDSACVSSDAQNVLDISKHILDGASKESAAAQDAAANVNSDAEDESCLTRSELAVIAISDDIKNESKISTCKSEDVSEESVIDQEADHDESYTYVGDGAQTEYEVATCHSEGAQVESDVIQELEDEDNTAGAANKLEITACELLGASLNPAMTEEADGDINTTDASVSPQKDTTMQKVDASEDTHFTEETNQSFTVQIPSEFTDAKETSIDDICGAFGGMNLQGDVYFDPSESATCPRNKLIISRRRRTPEEEEYLRGFNPRAPNFLPLELDPDAEKVDLKHQMMDERKNAEEWMIDYALRRAVTNLAPARKKKVELLVQAFETVLPHDEDDKKNISPTKPVQACN